MFRSLFCVLFMCILCTVYVFVCYSVYRLCIILCNVCVFCVLYYCHRVSAHLQFNNNNNNNNLKRCSVISKVTCEQWKNPT